MSTRALLSILAVMAGVSAVPLRLSKRVGSGKAGISWPVQEYDSSPVSKFFGPDSQVSWFYDWNKNYDNSVVPETPWDWTAPGEFVPMFFSPDFVQWGEGSANGLPEHVSVVLGFNEPDSGDAAVAKQTTPVEAAEAWKQMRTQVRAAHPDAKFASPAVASNIEWLDEFTTAICPDGLDGCEDGYDYVAVHSYRSTADAFKDDVQRYLKYGKPLIVSEFACVDFGENGYHCTDAEAVQFMSETTQWLDDNGSIYRYAYFGAMRKDYLMYGVPQSNSLMDANGELTPLGWQYVNGGRAWTSAEM